MRIVTRAQLMVLPMNTVYTPYAPCHTGSLYMKVSGPEYELDFIETDLVDGVVAQCSGEWGALHMQMEQGVSLPYDPAENTAKDGMFDHDQLYKVFEPADVKRMIELLQKSLTGEEIQ